MRGIVAALLAVAALALIGLAVLLSTGLSRGASEQPAARFAAAESGLHAALDAARSGGPALVRAAAWGSGANAAARDAEEVTWPASAPLAGVATKVGPPVPFGSARALGTELSERDQVAFESEVYRVESSAGRFALGAELVLPPTLADVSRR